MAAYAALLSFLQIIQQLQHHPRPPISLDITQVQSLTQNITFLQVFLEQGYTNEALENRIADAAYAAEDVIESRIVDQILAYNNISSSDFYQSLEKVIEDINSIKMEVMEIKENMESRNMLQRYPSLHVGSLDSSSQDISMVGFDDVLDEVMEKLIREQSDLQIVPIVGMGGAGKTTLVKSVYVNPLVVHHFDILVWVTVSQEYSAAEILTHILVSQMNKLSIKESSRMSEDELGEVLYKSLSGWRYLIVIDDIWSVDIWDEVKVFFPNNNNGSRIMITTRLSNLAFCVSGWHGIKMNFLDEDKSWILLRRKVFGNDDCPPELEGVGKKVAKNCRGLPLSVVVIGGLLAIWKSREYWHYIAENLNSIVNLEDNERCLQILYMSYNKLPVHLKPCFLYMGVFREDSIIRVSCLIKLWIAEGFLKPISSKSLEETAEEYFKDLVDRNLILAHKWSSCRRIKFCKIHDLLRDLCLREAQKQNFLLVIRNYNLGIPKGIEDKRRIVLYQSTLGGYIPQNFHPPPFAPSARSIICQAPLVLPELNFSLLKVLKIADECSYGCTHSLDDISRLVNLSFIAFKVYRRQSLQFPSSVCLFWNLQTLILHHSLSTTAPSGIWTMPQLRHVQFDRLELPEPPSDHMDDLVLENLQTLMEIKNFKCSEEVVKRIPNIKKLRICYPGFDGGTDYCLNNLGCLRKLESLSCRFYLNEPKSKWALHSFTFPHSLKKLTLEGSQLHWKDMTSKIGLLPLLQVLKLEFRSFVGSDWETVDGQFHSLKFLLIDSCCDLKNWTMGSSHFPQLEHLVLRGLEDLEEIPSGIGSSVTLRSIELAGCSTSAIISAKEILEEQEELGNEGLQVRVVASQYDKELMSLVSQNFHVQICQLFESAWEPNFASHH